MDSAEGSDLVPTFEDLSQTENFSEVKPPLTRIWSMKMMIDIGLDLCQFRTLFEDCAPPLYSGPTQQL